ncbi:MAG: hypothetical protein Q9201_004283 [Fulgogasparrea decipioides]
MRAAAHLARLNSIAEALWRVFQPVSRLQTAVLPQRAFQRPQIPKLQYRHVSFHARVKRRQPIQAATSPRDTGPLRDEAIGAQLIQIVNADKSLQPPRSLNDSLASINRQTYFLVQVGEKIHPRYENQPGPEEGQQDIRPRIPVCKVIDKGSFRLAEEAKLKSKKNASPVTKEVEINWGMAENDFKHRLERLKKFLDQGKRVEIVFGRKRKGWMQRKDVTDREAKSILEQVREAAGTVEGAREWKNMEGQVRGALVMFFEAKR